jgi:thioredoxin 1
MATIAVTDENFEAHVLKANQPVLIDFWAEWCGPCKMIAPILEELSTELEGKLTIAKMDIENSQMTPSKLGVRGIPTMMLFKDGKMSAMRVGALPKAQIKSWLSENGIG